MSELTTVSKQRSQRGVQGVYSHASSATNCEMTFAVYVPDHAPGETLPVLTYLSGLTCTHANVMEKGEYRKACAQHGIILVAPDTSPRGDEVPDTPAEEYDFGKGAGFYLDATQDPWATHYNMRSYIEEELPALIAENFPVDTSRASLFGHSMGGHGALTIGLRNPDRFRSVSAFAPITAPTQVERRREMFARYLGDDLAAMREYDAVALIEDGARLPELLVDQGTEDEFLEWLGPKQLEAACEAAGIPLTLRMQEGYDHAYFFVSTFMADHIAWHAERLKA
ncbi:MAG: S-formylglutathione hydrolase [Pseudomonadota bacterium]